MTQKSNKNIPEESRVLFIDLSNNFGGASVRALKILCRLPENRCALVSLEDSPVTNQAINMGVNVYEVGKNKFDPRIMIHLIKIIRSGNYNVLDTQNIQSKIWGSLASWLTKTALVSTLNSYYRIEHQNSIKGIIYQKLETITQILTDRNIVVSLEIQNYLIADGIGCEDIVLIPNAVDPDISQMKRNKNWLCTKFNIPQDCVISCSIGRLVEAKAFDFLITSASQIKHAGIHYIIIGEGHLKPSLKELIKQLEMEEYIHLTGFQENDETMKILSSSDFFVLSSNTEGTPIVLFEAAALSLPIIATHVGGIPDIVTDNKHALLVDSGDEAGLSKAIMNIYNNPGFAKQLALSAYKHVIKKNNISRQVEATLEVYDTALQLSVKRRC